MNYQDEQARDLEKFAFFKQHQHEIFTVFDARRWGGDYATVPAHLLSQARVTLLWGTRLPIPIPDLCANAEGVSGTLSFSSGLYYCTVPWRRVFVLLAGNQGAIWPLDVPISVSLTDLEQDYGLRPCGREPPPVAYIPPRECDVRRAGLRVIDGGRATPRPLGRRARLRSVPCPAPAQNLDDQFPDPPKGA